MHSIPFSGRATQLSAYIAWLALGLQLPLTVAGELAKGNSLLLSVAMFFSYFTIQSNLLGAFVLSAHAWPQRFSGRRAFLRTPWMTTSAAVGLSITFLVFNLVLRGTYPLAGLRLFADTLLHVVVPLLVIALWWYGVPRGAVHLRDIPRIALFPLFYLLFYFLWGAATGRYAYFFMDVSKLGYARALLGAGGVAVLFAVLALGKIAIKRPAPPVGSD